MMYVIELLQELVTRVQDALRKLEVYLNEKDRLKREKKIEKIMNELYSLDALIKINVSDLPYIHRRLTEDGRIYMGSKI